MQNKHEQENWSNWIQSNADYWTVIRRRNLRNERLEYPTLAEAEAAANQILAADRTARLMIYAVCGVHDCWVKNVMHK